MTAAPKVSVLMSVFNGQPYLDQAVESILSQSFDDFEFVVVDDGSEDSTWQVLNSFLARDHRLVLLRNTHNLGYTRSLNIGIRQSRGLYVARQDADDVSLPGRLSRQVDFLDSNPDVGLVGTLSEFTDDGGEHRWPSNLPIETESERIREQLLNTNCIRHGSVMFRRSLLDIVGPYNPTLEPSEDYDLWLRLSEVTQLANLPETLYLYREHAKSVSSRRRPQQVFNKALALEAALLRRFPSSPPPERLKRLVARDFLRAAYFQHVTGAESEARASLKRAQEWSHQVFVTGPVLEGAVWRYLCDEPAEDAIRHAESLFGGFLPLTGHVRSVGSRLLSKLHMRVVFEAQEKGERRGDIRLHWWRGVRSDPRWLLNLGVWVIGVRELMTRPNGVGGCKGP
jgi:GT2 family glycosyltransferase